MLQQQSFQRRAATPIVRGLKLTVA
eukprot:COSAG06_NODE_51973_length_308_cov_2.598086_1_plen_24_part_01